MSDTIAAIATAPMKSAIGIIRISGQDALAISNKVFLGNHGENPRNMVTGKFLSKNGDICDFGMGVYFKAPASFTGEDCVEFYTHGSLAVLRTILISLYHAGARPANPGEFTHRAFLNGKMDLTQAEAIIDLIDSETELSARNAAEQMNGSLGREISSISQICPLHFKHSGSHRHMSLAFDYYVFFSVSFHLNQCSALLLLFLFSATLTSWNNPGQVNCRMSYICMIIF